MKVNKSRTLILIIVGVIILLFLIGILILRFLSTLTINLDKNTSITALQLIKTLVVPPDRNAKNKIPLGSDNNYFKDTQGNIYWYHNVASEESQKPYFQKIQLADASTFTELSCGNPPWVNCDYGFGKDKNHVYREGVILENVDPASFKFVSVNSCIINKPCFEDKSHIYIFQLGKSGEFIYIPMDSIKP